MLKDLSTKLSKAIVAPLPGMEAQKHMAPKPDVSGRFEKTDRSGAIESAVMILLYEEHGAIFFPLMERAQYPGIHSGQISLPGGKKEAGDRNHAGTALRETYEELGVNPDHVRIIGELTELYIPPSNFLVYPVVGFVPNKPDFLLEQKEVAKLIQVELDDILTTKNVKRKQATFKDDLKVEIPFFDIQDHTIWGATAMILSEFSTIVNNLNKNV